MLTKVFKHKYHKLLLMLLGSTCVICHSGGGVILLPSFLFSLFLHHEGVCVCWGGHFFSTVLGISFPYSIFPKWLYLSILQHYRQQTYIFQANFLLQCIFFSTNQHMHNLHPPTPPTHTFIYIYIHTYKHTYPHPYLPFFL